MATLIENAAAVKSAAQAIDAAIVAKGGTTTGGLTNAAAAIAAIPSGGGWEPPSYWPDLREVVKNNSHGYAHVAAFLFDRRYTGDTFTIPSDTVLATSDGAFYTSTAIHYWDATKDIGGKYGWIVVLSDSTIIIKSIGKTYYNTRSLLWIYAPECDIETHGVALFNNAYCLVSVTANKMQENNDNSYAGFGNTSSLENFDVNEVVTCRGNAHGYFQYSRCHHLKKIVYRNVSNLNSTFRGNSMEIDELVLMYNNTGTQYSGEVLTMPKKIVIENTANDNLVLDVFPTVYATPEQVISAKSFSLTKTTYVSAFKSKFADFDASGNLIGGMAYNMNAVTGLTATISSKIKGFFTAHNDPPDGTSEQEKIEAAFNAKGWTLAW